MLARIRSFVRAHPRLVVALRWALSLGLLALTLAWIDVHAVVAPLRRADPIPLVVALLLSVPMMALMAARWCFTARRMGVALPFGVACRDYYVSTLLNSVLPGGVAGDVVRVARQAGQADRPLGLVARSVVVERAVGQLVLWLLLLGSAVLWGLGDVAAALLLALALGLLGLLAVRTLARHPRIGSTAAGRLLARIDQELRAALGSGRALAVQLATSLGSLLALVAMYICCAHSIGCPLGLAQALLVVPGILAATAVPLTVGGWGLRELSATALFPLASLPAAQGAASSVAFGAVCLVAVLPGLVPLVLRRRPR